ncbi:MAG: hypothetical protein RR614_15595 [Eubacterium sp.]
MKLKEFVKEATSDQIDQILKAETADAFLALAKEFDVDLSQADAEILAETNVKHRDKKKSGELLDDELEAVSGGSIAEDGMPKIVYCYYSCDSFVRDSKATVDDNFCMHCKYSDGVKHRANMICTL